MSQNPQAKQAKKVYTLILPNEVYKKLEAKFRRPTVSNTTSEVEAGYLLGVQDVLRALREGHVVEEN